MRREIHSRITIPLAWIAIRSARKCASRAIVAPRRNRSSSLRKSHRHEHCSPCRAMTRNSPIVTSAFLLNDLFAAWRANGCPD
jgi:hypothetical protein